MSTSTFSSWLHVLRSRSVQDLELLLRRVMSTVWLTSGQSAEYSVMAIRCARDSRGGSGAGIGGQ